MSNDLIKRAEVLGRSLDNGVLNIKELRAFLASVEAFKPLPDKKQPKKEERFHHHLANLNKPNNRVHHSK